MYIYIYWNLNNIVGRSVLAVRKINSYSLLDVALLLLPPFGVDFFFAGPVMENKYLCAGS